MEIFTDNPPLFSVIINNYNYGRYIEEAIGSVFNQTFPQDGMEIIVVDDGSTDDTSERVKKYSGKIRYIAKKNGGQASALNIGIKHSRGKIIAFLDADDYWQPTKLDSICREFEKSDVIDFVYHFMDVVDDMGRIVDRYVYPDPLSATNPKEPFLERYLRGNLPWFSPTSGMTIRADCLKKACPIPQDFRIGADLYLHYILPFYARELSLIRKPLGYYRLHGSNLSGGNLLTAEKVSRETEMIVLIKEHITEYSRKLGYDSHFLIERLESFVIWYEVLLNILMKEKGKALKKIIRFDRFLPDDDFLYKCFRKTAMLAYVVFPPSLCFWIQRRYRKLWYLLGRDLRKP
jgi:glycosyltransferase involved in cell wall biosynthesis